MGSRRSPASALDAVKGNPLRFFASIWPLRALAYVASGAVVGAVTLVWLAVALVLGLVMGAPLLVQPLAAVERRRVALLGSPPLPNPHRPPDRPGALAWLRARYTEAATWRELAYAALCGTVLLAVNLVAVALLTGPILLLGSAALTVGPSPGTSSGGPVASSAGGDLVVTTLVAGLVVLALMVVAFVAIVYALPLAAILHSELARVLLAPGPEAAVGRLTRSRARLVDAFEVERRRIERDLHDGAQQRLLELGMTLVAAQLELEDDPNAAKPLVQRAADQAKSALAELRELVRGIHPEVLTDLGLEAAVAELADRSTVPVTTRLDIPKRPPAAVESAAYFVIAEALTNAVKHAAATTITVAGMSNEHRLVFDVTDDGIGGAGPRPAGGLAGLADRVDALGGTLTVSSPRGGPTSLSVELPCSG